MCQMHTKYYLHHTISFARGSVTFGEYFRGKGASPTNQCWCQKTRVIALSCGVKVSAVHRLVLSQYTPLSGRQTDRQNSDSNTMHCITCSHTVKMQTERRLTCLMY